MRPRRLLALLALSILLAAAGCGGGGDDGGGGGGGDKNITFWLSEDVAQRVNAIQQIVNRFQQQSGVQVDWVDSGGAMSRNNPSMRSRCTTRSGLASMWMS